jgi:hypothetical protein
MPEPETDPDIDNVWTVPIQAITDPNVARALVEWADGHNPDLTLWFRASCEQGEALRDAVLAWEKKETRSDG